MIYFSNGFLKCWKHLLGIFYAIKTKKLYREECRADILHEFHFSNRFMKRVYNQITLKAAVIIRYIFFHIFQRSWIHLISEFSRPNLVMSSLTTLYWDGCSCCCCCCCIVLQSVLIEQTGTPDRQQTPRNMGRVRFGAGKVKVMLMKL